MRITEKIINVNELNNFIKKTYKVNNFNGNNIFIREDNGLFVLNNFYYLSVDQLDISQEDKNIKYFMLLNEDNNDIIAMIKFSSKFLNDNKYYNNAAQMFYLDINKKYQYKGFLKVLSERFANYFSKNYNNIAFVSNKESRQGKRAKVNNHLQNVFKEKSIRFYNSDVKFYNDK